MIWNGIEGKLTLFFDGYAVDGFTQNENLKTRLLSGKSFAVGSSGDDDEKGTLTQLNIWDYEISSGNVVAMSAGGLNVHGSVLSWSSLAKYVSDKSIQWNTDIYLPGNFTKVLFSYFWG